LPPDMLLDRYQEVYLKRVHSLRKGLDQLYSDSADDRVWSISGRAPALSYTAQLLRQATKETFLVLTDEDLEELRSYIRQASDRGVAVNALLTGSSTLVCGRVAHHPPLESELQGLLTTLLVVVDDAEVLIAGASSRHETVATITRNSDLVLIARQFVWMELFTQRVHARLGRDLLDRLDPEDRSIFESLTGKE
jgi:sugar-specific transcriptional regulator TrmB